MSNHIARGYIAVRWFNLKGLCQSPNCTTTTILLIHSGCFSPRRKSVAQPHQREGAGCRVRATDLAARLCRT